MQENNKNKRKLYCTESVAIRKNTNKNKEVGDS